MDPSKITVRDVMSKAVISVDSKINVNEAAKMMEDTKVGAIIVMENNNPVGIVTDRDFAIKVVAHAYPITTSIKQIMSSPLITVNSDESVWIVSDLMRTRRVRKLPVVDNDEVVGIITSTDLVNQLSIATDEDIRKMYHHSVIKVYQNYSPYH